MFWAHFAALEVSWRSHEEEGYINSLNTSVNENSANTQNSGSNTSMLDDLRTRARSLLDQAQSFCDAHAQARPVLSEIQTVEKMLRESTFYSPVTNEEMENIVKAMAREFRGTGHWYRCANGHPFTVGECGGPMQQAQCPQCGAPIGGQHHQAAEGVTRADDLERGMRNLRM